MREIKFRGKRIDNGELTYGSLVTYRGGELEIFTPFNPNDELCMKNILEKVDPKTVGQYTTLKDDNGKEIYQGDLVKFEDRKIVYKVIWDPYRVAWWLKDVKADKRERDSDNDHQQLLNNSWQRRVIIGNIYENPELLEGKR